MLPDNNEYKNLAEAIQNKVRQAQYQAMVKANGEMIQMYWSIGNMLNEQVRYSNSFIDTLAKESRRVCFYGEAKAAKQRGKR